MKKYVSVLNDVICLDEIKKISIVYNNGTNYGNSWLHSLFVTYKDGTTEKYNTTDYSQAKQDYENLKTVLLGSGDDYPNGCDTTAEAKEMLKNGEYPNYCPNCGAKMKGGAV